MTDHAGSIFDSFNARALTPEQVAKTFVPSSQYKDLLKRRHSIVLGPRGSGKTTLLKMLQPLALESWNHPDADELASRIDFTGIFVATDIGWSEQLLNLGSGKLDPETRQLLSVASFTTHTLRSLVTAFEQCCGRSTTSPNRRTLLFDLRREVEASIVTGIADAWQLPPVLPSLAGLRQALTMRLSDIREIASREAVAGENGRSARMSAQRYLHLNFLASAMVALELLDEALGRTSGKWAFLFDELELAPPWILHFLMRSLRSTDGRFLFKLALNPYIGTLELNGETSATPTQDYDAIPLWYGTKRDSYAFCESLWKQMLKDRGIATEHSAAEILGTSYFEPEAESQSDDSAYGPESRWSRLFSRLAAVDTSFQKYLSLHDITPLSLDLKRGSARASEVRKVAPIVAIREFYLGSALKAGQGAPRIRSRKSPVLYTGEKSVFAISEGNPRWFIAITERLLNGLCPPLMKISARTQAKELKRSAERFNATLRTIPRQSRPEQSISVEKLVETIAEYFHKAAVRGPFRPDPHGSFIVDPKVPESVKSTVCQALNAGALVYIPTDGSDLRITTVDNRRFRLSYLLAPLYGFPIRLGKAVALSTILSVQVESTRSDQQHLRLFSEEDFDAQ